ncbi:hypothetical protein ACOBR2_09615 [Telmatobacter bradus]|uniref:hypothetical protein n=1 Tax=Telmatobacter bradus TaxID=474953 RepID=UPI003B430670
MSGLIRFISYLSASLLLTSASLSLEAQGTRLWTQSQLGDFEKGTAQGVELTSDGRLVDGAVAQVFATTPSSQVWSLAAGPKGVLYAATGSPAAIYRMEIDKDGKTHFDKEKNLLFESKDLNVQVLHMGPDGNLYAALLPSGKVIQISPRFADKLDESKATVVFDPEISTVADYTKKKSHFVWDLTFDKAGRLYIATGDPAAIYRVDVTRPGSKPEEFFKSDEAHIRALAWDAKGNLIAGSDGTGLVYRIDSTGKGYVLFAAPRREVTAVAVDAAGTIYAACVGEKSRNPLPPLPLQNNGISIVLPGSMGAAGASSVLPEGSEVFALTEGQAPRKLWAARDEVVYALESRTDGVLALAGNHGRIFRIQANGNSAVVAQLDAQQVLSFTAAPGGGELYLGTGNPGKLYLFGAAGEHEYSSQVFDAAVLARFGHVEVAPDARAYKLFTRTGNVEQPVRGWTEWQPLKDGVVASPAGRFLQWKAIFEKNGSLASVGVNYLPVNAAPVVDDLVVISGARVNAPGAAAALPQTVMIGFPTPQPASSGLNTAEASGNNTPLAAMKDRTAVTARWAAHDDNGDELSYALYLRGDGESVWRLIKDKINEKAYSLDATQLPDGGYQIKIVASDAPSHEPTDTLTAEKISTRFEVDTTPPVISGLKASRKEKSLQIEFLAEDASSPLAHAEYSIDAGTWEPIFPEGKLFDYRRLHFNTTLDSASPDNSKLDSVKLDKSEHLITVRVYDRHDNVGLAKTVLGEQR